MTPMLRYNHDISQKLVSFDGSQKHVVEAFDALYERLVLANLNHKRVFSFFEKLVGANPNVRGIYLWGGVGRGKTYLMDLFYECLPFSEKHRVHFHRFMLSIHEELERLQGVRNPLDRIAARIAGKQKFCVLMNFLCWILVMRCCFQAY